MTLPDNVHDAIKERFNAEDVKVVSNAESGNQEVFAYGMLPDMTIMGWFPLGDLDELEKKLRETGEL